MSATRVVPVPGLYDSRVRGYEQCVVAGNLVFVAGQVGLDAGGEIVSPEFDAQAHQALRNVALALDAAGATPADITAMTVYLTDMTALRAFGVIRREVLGEIAATSTTVEVSALAMPGLLVEVTVTAVRDSS